MKISLSETPSIVVPSPQASTENSLDYGYNLPSGMGLAEARAPVRYVVNERRA
jgi:hypothetical protein